MDVLEGLVYDGDCVLHAAWSPCVETKPALDCMDEEFLDTLGRILQRERQSLMVQCQQVAVTVECLPRLAASGRIAPAGIEHLNDLLRQGDPTLLGGFNYSACRPIRSLLDAQLSDSLEHCRDETLHQIELLECTYPDFLPEADYAYLLDLYHERIADDTKTLTVFACVAEFLQSDSPNRQYELEDSLPRLGSC